jgi:hypothetical protein
MQEEEEGEEQEEKDEVTRGNECKRERLRVRDLRHVCSTMSHGRDFGLHKDNLHVQHL